VASSCSLFIQLFWEYLLGRGGVRLTKQEIRYIFHVVSIFSWTTATSWEARNKPQLPMNDHAPKNGGSMPAIQKRSPLEQDLSLSQSMVLISGGRVCPVIPYLHFTPKCRIRMLPVGSNSQIRTRHTVRPHTQHNLPQLAYRIARTRHTNNCSSACRAEGCRRMTDKIKVRNRAKHTLNTPMIRFQHKHAALEKITPKCPQHNILIYI